MLHMIDAIVFSFAGIAHKLTIYHHKANLSPVQITVTERTVTWKGETVQIYNHSKQLKSKNVCY